MSVVVTLEDHAWIQTSESLIGTKLNHVEPASCSECKREPNLVCCPKFRGNVTIDAVPNVSPIHIFYFFKILADPEELFQLFRSSNLFQVRSVDHLDVEIQVRMTAIFDTKTIDAVILQSAIAKKPNLVALELIETQRKCALHYQDWERYNMVVGLWGCFAMVCLFDRTPEVRDYLQNSVNGFLVGDHPDRIFRRVVAICGLVAELLDDSFMDQLLQNNERFRNAFLINQLVSQLFR
jgi:hypothetical protein